MLSDIDRGWWRKARPMPTENCNARPPETDVNLLVIHNISLPPNQFGGHYVEQFFLNTLPIDEDPWFENIRGMKVSSHCFVKRDGATIQFVPFHLRAWHAGRSCFQGKDECNDYSIGVELEGSDHIPYTEEQYRSLADLTRCLLEAYPAMNTERIVGHEHIAPDRKTDPGEAFDWDYYRSLL